MGTSLNLNEITTQIQQYVKLLKQRRVSEKGEIPLSEREDIFIRPNDVVSNINKLNGNNKFSIQNMTEEQNPQTPAEYAAEAYTHLSQQENKNKVVIDFMHKNNRNFDMKA